MQQTENQLAQDQTPANAHEDAHGQAALEAKYKQAQLAVSMALDADGAEHGSAAQAVNISKLLKVRSVLRSEIIAILHQTPGLGNDFVQMVLNFEHHPEAAAVQGAGTVDTKPGWKSPLSNKQLHDMADDGKEDGKNAATPAAPAQNAKPQMDAASQAPTPAPVANEPKKESAPEPAKDAAPTANQAPASTPGPAEVKPQQAAPEPAKEAAPPANAPAVPAGQANEGASNERTVTITASVLNVRAAPTTGAAIIGRLRRGEQVKVVREQNGWLKLEGEGWISARYTTSAGGNQSGEEESEEGGASAHQPKQERPKNATQTNDDQNQQGVRV